MNEVERLGAAAPWYLTRQLGFDRKLVGFRHRAIHPWLRGGAGLELGPAEGVMTALLLDDFASLTVVDSAEALLAAIPAHPRLRKVRSLFEDYRPSEGFDTIVVDHVLEHVVDPRALLAAVRDWMRPEARLIVGVPNALSFHRLAAVRMRLLTEPTELNDRDREVGHRRVYTADRLRADVEASGFTVRHEGGVFFKPLSNAQIDASWTDEMLEGFYLLGLDFPGNAAEIFAVCERAP